MKWVQLVTRYLTIFTAPRIKNGQDQKRSTPGHAMTTIPHLPRELVEHIASFADIEARRALGVPPRRLREFPEHIAAMQALDDALHRKLACQICFPGAISTILVSSNARTIYEFRYHYNADMFCILQSRMSPRYEVYLLGGWCRLIWHAADVVDGWCTTWAGWLDGTPRICHVKRLRSLEVSLTAANAAMILACRARASELQHPEPYPAMLWKRMSKWCSTMFACVTLYPANNGTGAVYQWDGTRITSAVSSEPPPECNNVFC